MGLKNTVLGLGAKRGHSKGAQGGGPAFLVTLGLWAKRGPMPSARNARPLYPNRFSSSCDGHCTQEWHYPEDAGSYFTFCLPDMSAMFKVWSPNHDIYPREQAELVDDADQDELDDEASLVPTDLAGSD